MAAMGVNHPRHAVRWHACFQLAAVLAIALAAVVWLDTRRRIEALPEIGRATPIEELRAAWAEADEEEKSREPVTMPQLKPERCP
jgi:hypothetical protein